MGHLATFRWLNRQPGFGGTWIRTNTSGQQDMTKSELIMELAASNPHLRGADVELIVATVFDQITDALSRGERVNRGKPVRGVAERVTA